MNFERKMSTDFLVVFLFFGGSLLNLKLNWRNKAPFLAARPRKSRWSRRSTVIIIVTWARRLAAPLLLRRKWPAITGIVGSSIAIIWTWTMFVRAVRLGVTIKAAASGAVWIVVAVFALHAVLLFARSFVIALSRSMLRALLFVLLLENSFGTSNEAQDFLLILLHPHHVFMLFHKGQTVINYLVASIVIVEKGRWNLHCLSFQRVSRWDWEYHNWYREAAQLLWCIFLGLRWFCREYSKKYLSQKYSMLYLQYRQAWNLRESFLGLSEALWSFRLALKSRKRT